MFQPPRIGVYVCHCGSNIAGVVRCEDVAKEVEKTPGVVVSKAYKYMCSEAGQNVIIQDIKEHKLNRVVVAACTPKMHEPTFRRTLEKAGLNEYLFEMANIREHCSWVHRKEPEEATAKATEITRMAIARSRLLEPQEKTVIGSHNEALVIGGGVAGIQASLTLAEMGFRVYLVEKDPSIGGHMAQLDKTFPTMNCSICILGPKMVDVLHHPNITLLTHSEVQDIRGYIGNFKVKILRKPRYIIEEKCNGCGKCVETCPVYLPNEFDVETGPRKAIYTPFPQAVPVTYRIDLDHCIQCHKCVDVCKEEGREAIDFDQKEETIKLEDIGTVVVATGCEAYDASKNGDYGYGVYDNVITSIELERLINAGGPTAGELTRLSDGRHPKRVAFIQCVGSRNEKIGNIYCSSICCMNTVKNSILIKEHQPETEIYVFYTDVRAHGKGFEEFYRRALEEGVTFIRGKPSEVYEDPETRNLMLDVEDTLSGLRLSLEFDMVVLAVGLTPRKEDALSKVLPLPKTSEGFYLEAHPKLRPVDTPLDGIYICGLAEGPKDIRDSVTQASAAAAMASIPMLKGKIEVESITALVDAETCKMCGLCAKVCPFGAITVEEVNRTPAVMIEAACKGCGTCAAECSTDAITMRHFTDKQILAQVESALEVNPHEKIVAFCCNWCSYAGADYAGVSGIQYPTNVRIIRVMCSGRVDPTFIYRAFELGAGMVLVSGCKPNDCHYLTGNYYCEKRIQRVRARLQKTGIAPHRLRLEWISATEGKKFAQVITEMTSQLKELAVANK